MLNSFPIRAQCLQFVLNVVFFGIKFRMRKFPGVGDCRMVYAYQEGPSGKVFHDGNLLLFPDYGFMTAFPLRTQCLQFRAQCFQFVLNSFWGIDMVQFWLDSRNPRLLISHVANYETLIRIISEFCCTVYRIFKEPHCKLWENHEKNPLN